MSAHRSTWSTIAACCALLGSLQSAHAQCPRVSDAFGLPGIQYPPTSMSVVGTGVDSRAYVTGGFGGIATALYGTTTGSGIGRWDGSAWSFLPQPPSTQEKLYEIVEFDDDLGETLYACGRLVNSLHGVWRWTGSAWQLLGAFSGITYDMKVFDDGSGSALYVAGAFEHVNGIPSSNVARWNGASWSAVGSGTARLAGAPEVRALATWNDGGGAKLYAAGLFDSAGGAPAANVAAWDGSQWSALGAGVNDVVTGLVVHDDGSGSSLFAAGDFTMAGGANALRVARWSGASWNTLGAGLGAAPKALCSLPSPGGAHLVAGGSFTTAGASPANHLASWDGAQWAPLGAGVDGVVTHLRRFDGVQGPQLLVGGSFANADGHWAPNFVRWSPSGFRPLESDGILRTPSASPDVPSADAFVADMVAFDDGSGPALFACGDFTAVSSTQAPVVARWTPTTGWAPVFGGGSNITGGEGEALAVFDDGNGPALYLGGRVSFGGGSFGLLRWNGAAWSAVADTLDGRVRALCVFDDGTGSALHAAGSWSTPGGIESGVSRWNGTAWTWVATNSAGVRALFVHDDGPGPALYAGGDFLDIAGTPARAIARYDGTGWAEVGGGFGFGSNAAIVYSMCTWDDGSGPELYVGGRFTSSATTSLSHVARWNGSTWSSVGSPTTSEVHALATFDDGRGRGTLLYASGFVDPHTANPSERRAYARFDGAAWEAGLERTHRMPFVPADGEVFDFCAFDAHDGHGPSLFVGGGFDFFGTTYSPHLARLIPCDEAGATFCFGDGSATACPCGNASAVGERAGCVNSSGAAGSLRGVGNPSLTDDSLRLVGAGTMTSPGLFFQGTGRANGGAGVVFGDGLRCTSGPFVRLGIKVAVQGASSFPGPLDGPISVRGFVTSPGTRHYQLRYRDSATFCRPEAFNYTNAVTIVWTP